MSEIVQDIFPVRSAEASAVPGVVKAQAKSMTGRAWSGTFGWSAPRSVREPSFLRRFAVCPGQNDEKALTRRRCANIVQDMYLCPGQKVFSRCPFKRRPRPENSAHAVAERLRSAAGLLPTGTSQRPGAIADHTGPWFTCPGHEGSSLRCAVLRPATIEHSLFRHWRVRHERT